MLFVHDFRDSEAGPLFAAGGLWLLLRSSYGRPGPRKRTRASNIMLKHPYHATLKMHQDTNWELRDTPGPDPENSLFSSKIAFLAPK